ncbi:uncharacterized protein VTP21DRAFT_458 [Calcarisporiella thermophila]|uniref:uncharacterized protein n=1 Tax=Calcarisporiella thermophila TaxID=911321 RepID=UPI0037434ECC
MNDPLESQETPPNHFDPANGSIRLPSRSLPRPRSPIPPKTAALLDGQNTPQNITLYSFGLGALFGASVVLPLYSSIPQLWIFIAAISVFHVLEYFATALYNPSKLSLDSFLINHSIAYTAAHTAGIVEFLVELYLFPQWKRGFSIISWTGFFILLIGQVARTLAMLHAKSNFSHQIVDFKTPHHQLVTTGIFKYLRHPSYFGFYYWALGTQIMLRNPLCVLGFLPVLHNFFSSRIEYEEHTLVRFFGHDYRAYRSRTPTYIPFIS